jgi:hypothetical protein
MSRSAEYTIRGFVYQFNKSLLAILQSGKDEEITLEGIVEDVEVRSPGGLTAIQCKYHGSVHSFVPSKIYEPLLQMMRHFHQNRGASVRYILFGHFRGMEDAPQRSELKRYVQSALRSQSLALKVLISEFSERFDVDGFLRKFSMELGPDLDTLTSQVYGALRESGIPGEDIDTLAYPNAVNMVATLSTKADVLERTITKASLLAHLMAVRRTAISRWTMALGTRKKLLDARRRQLKPHLSINSRLRCFLINFDQLGAQVDQFVSFVRDYLNRYHFKPAHNLTPIFCLSSKEAVLPEIAHLLFEKGVKAADGYVAGHFEQSDLFREPLCARKNSEFRREFQLRLVRWQDHGSLLGSQKCDDLFVIGDLDLNSLKTSGWEIEQISTSSLAELKFILGVSDVID